METKSIFVGFTVPPSLEDIEAVAEAVLDDLPEGLQKYIGKLKILVEDFPDTFIEQEMDLETPFDLLGCYQSSGPAAVGHLAMNAKHQDVLYLYRRPILDAWADTSEDITSVINRVIIQEIGHHFGFSPHEIEMYEEDMSGATAPGIRAG
ncbi:MAG: metallopeptidase family protein [Pseudomonadota bacterium]